ncbi:MAG: radical SAM protein [Halanaerobiales bacterium]|nr:radical SAM protein [Halanaerobiales bacterium]
MDEHIINKFSVWMQDEKVLIISPSPLDWIVTNKEGYDFFSEMIDNVNEFKKLLPHFPDSVHNLYYFLEKNLFAEKDEYNGNAYLFSSPQTIYFHLTNKCNLNCKYCYAHKYKNYLPEMTYSIGVKILDQFKVQLPSSYLVFTGGEPMLNPDFHRLVEYSLDLGFRVGLLTNGTLIENIPENLLKKIDYQISLDGISADINNLTRGRFEDTMSGINKLLELGIRPEIRATLTKYTKDHALDFYKYWEERGINARFFVIRKFGIDEEFENLGLNDEELLHIFNKFSVELGSYKKALRNILVADHMSFFKPINCCGIGNSNIAVDGLGNIYPCIHLCVSNLKIGNILEQSITDISSSKILEKIRCKVEDINTCKVCPFRYICGGGCKAETYFQTKNFSTKYPNCDFLKNIILKCMFEEELVVGDKNDY